MSESTVKVNTSKRLEDTRQSTCIWTCRRTKHRRGHWGNHVTARLMIVLCSVGLSELAIAQDTDVQRLDNFAHSINPWQEIRINENIPPNHFQLKTWDSVNAVEVVSQASMSLLGRAIDVNLEHTPLLCWRWRIDAPLQTADMTRKSGDDYAARLYISLALPESEKGFLLNTQLALARAIWGQQLPDAAINYVWDNLQAQGTIRPNAYTDRTTMVVLQSGSDQTGRWISEARHLRHDIERLYSFNAKATQIAIGADTDNTGESARAGFADIHFASEATGCQFPG